MTVSSPGKIETLRDKEVIMLRGAYFYGTVGTSLSLCIYPLNVKRICERNNLESDSSPSSN